MTADETPAQPPEATEDPPERESTGGADLAAEDVGAPAPGPVAERGTGSGEDAGPRAPAPGPASGSPSAEAAVPRRRFLEMAAVCAGACAGAGVLGAAAAAVVGTPLRAGPAGELWVDVGPLARLPEGQPVKVALEGERRDAWQRLPRRTLGNAVAIRRGEEVVAWSATCPHNGCDVVVAEGDLLCPCHVSRFAPADGVVLLGPSPRGLDRLETRVDEGRVLVRFQRFALGTAERRPL
ncbi:MAG: Rieske 2Fe-2S domain-containing protein [Planctomycetes bacterium]|nr:Rieske 2Fe-2S domain-containing protein [Planctomycetota bacterium]